jgi:transposase-like protein
MLIKSTLSIAKKWVYQLNLIDSKGNLIASFVSEKRDEEAAKLLMKLAKEETDKRSEILVTDGNTSYKKAKNKLGRKLRDKEIIHNKKIIIISNRRIEAFHSKLAKRSIIFSLNIMLHN